MDDLPSSIRLQQNSTRPRTGEELETFGKEAATKYVRGEHSSLTEAVVETVKSAGLSPEQVRRVVEFTNIDAFNQEFRKEAAGHRVVEFKGGPANFSEVLKDLNDGGSVELDKHAFDYSVPPLDVVGLHSRNEDRLGLENAKLAEAFGVEEQPLPYADPLRDAEDLKCKLAGAEEELAAELSHLEGQYLDTVEGLYGSVKQAAMDGVHLGQIVSAWSTVVSKPEFVKAAFEQLTPRLLEAGVFYTKEAIGDSLTKTASRGLVNSEHPVMVYFCDFCETLTKLAETRLAQQEVKSGLDTLCTFLKSAAGPGWQTLMGAAQKAVPVAGRSVGQVAQQAAPAAQAVQQAAPSIAGMIGKGWGAATGAAQKAAPVLGKAVEKAVPYAPHALAGYVGLRALGSSPAQKALGYVPGTQQNAVRRYYAQQGGQ